MKTWSTGDMRLSLLTLLLVSFALVACGPSAKTVRPAEPAPTAEPEPAAEPEPEAVAEPEPAAEEPEDEDAVVLGPYGEARLMLDEQSVVKFRELAPKADELLREALAAEPNRPEIHYNLGVLALRVGKPAEARQHFERTVQLESGFASAYARMGAMLLDAGNETRGRELLEQALSLDKYNPVAQVALANLEISRRRYEEAERHARSALLGDSNDMNAYLALATCYYRMKRNDLGKLVCLNALSINPHAAPIYNLLGLFQLREDDVRTAIAQFNRAIEEDPELLDAHLNLGATTLSNGDFTRALAHFDFVLEREPDDVEAMMSRAVALRGLGKYDEAKAGYQKVLSADPGNGQAQYNLCVLYHEYVEDLDTALGTCRGYLSTLGRRDAKYKEMVRRVRAIKKTIELLKAMGPEEEPAPAETPSAPPEASPDEAPTEEGAAPATSPEGGAEGGA